MHTLASNLPIARYFPFASGNYSTAPGLHKLTTDFGNGEADQKVFQVDAHWAIYLQNKADCRQEDIGKYFKTHQFKEETARQVAAFMTHQLLYEYPLLFSLDKQQDGMIFINRLTQERICFDQKYILKEESRYVATLDALAAQVQEDMAVWQLEGERDWMTMIHLCAPNHWSPAEKIGQPFSVVHEPVAGMESMRQRYLPMLKRLFKGDSFVRFAWGLSTDQRLNHHPEAPVDMDAAAWKGRSFDPENPSLYVRVERQTLTGFPEVDAVLFTIRTYFEEVGSLRQPQREALLHALTAMSSETMEYKGLKDDLKNIKMYLLNR